MKNTLFVLSICICTVTCQGTIIGGYPGLKQLVEESDAIVVLLSEGPVADAPMDFSSFSTQMCMIYQRLKGDIPVNSRVKLRLMNPHGYSRSSTHRSFSTGTTYLAFLVKKRSPGELTDYHTLERVGATIRLSPLGHEKMPEGDGIIEQVKSLVVSAKEYWAEQARREFEFYDMIVEDKQPNPAPQPAVTNRRG